MKLYHMNRDAMSRADFLDASMGMRNREGADLYRRLMSEGAYVLVAEIDGDDPEDAWTASQNGVRTDSWALGKNRAVRPVGGGERGYRSSMVGDVMHVADVIGFVEIGPIIPDGLPPAP